MIRPPGFRGAAFGAAADGDGRDDATARSAISRRLGISSQWASLRQVHSDRIRRAWEPGLLGEGDAAFSTVPGLPMVVATADCLPVVVEAEGAAGIAHAGWRGAAAGTVGALIGAMEDAGHPPRRAAVGPGIGACCFEVGPDVEERFPGHRARTSWGSTSVDLPAVIRAQLEGLQVWEADTCTMCGAGYHSYRRERTRARQVALAWIP
jgi:hypothetical protein